MLTQIETSPAPANSAAPPVELQEIDINVTNLCNLECIYCSYSSTPGRDEPTLPRARVLRLLDEARGMGVRVIHFSGGEPVIRPDMPDLISHATELGFRLRMHSNGALLTKNKLRQLWDAGLRRVLISLDGPDGDHDFHRCKPGLYARTMAGIENAVSLGYDVRVNSVATTGNVDRIPQLMPMLASLGVATFSVFYLIPVGRGRDVIPMMVPPRRWRRFVQEMRDMAATCRPQRTEVTVEKVFRWADEEPFEENGPGGRGHGCLGFLKKCDYVNVLADGRVYPCVCLIDVAPPLGNIHSKPLHEILHDSRSWAFYHDLVGLNGACHTCECASQCAGGSKALSRIIRGEWKALDPRCGGDPRSQGYFPLCFMLRENINTGLHRGFAEHVN